MSLILLIDSSAEKAQVSIAKDAVILETLYNDSIKDHASFIQPAIEQLFSNAAIPLKNIDAIAIAAGPGSYTGLRVGMASAKGLCYVLQKPLISLNTLEIMAASAIRLLPNTRENPSDLFCPMIDARRMEVYTAIYNSQLQLVMPPVACVLTKLSFIELLHNQRIIFFGNGAEKWKILCKHTQALFENVALLPEDMARLAERDYIQRAFSDLSQTEPIYLK